MQQELLTVKLVTLFAMLIGSIIISFLPIVLLRWGWLRARVKWMEKVIKFIKVIEGLAGGVLLGGGLLHLIPDASHELANAILHNVQRRKGNEEAWYIEFPWAPLLAASALLLIYFMEHVLLEFVSYFVHRRGDHNTKSSNIQQHSSLTPAASSEDIQQQQPQNQNEVVVAPDQVLIKVNRSSNSSHSGNVVVVVGDDELTVNEDATMAEIQLDKGVVFDELEDEVITDENDHQHHGNHIMRVANAVVLWLALCTHALFEGLGLGAETDSKTMWTLFAAIIAHKGLESFTLGIIIEKGIQSGRSVGSWAYWRHMLSILFFVLSFTLASPLGIGIGIAITQTGHNHEADSWVIVQSCLLAFASGSFIYISLFEILGEHEHDHEQKSLKDHHHHHSHNRPHPIIKLTKFSLFLLGFTAMAVLAVWG